MSVSLPATAVSNELIESVCVPSVSCKSAMSLALPVITVSIELTDACRSEVTEPPATASKELTDACNNASASSKSDTLPSNELTDASKLSTDPPLFCTIAANVPASTSIELTEDTKSAMSPSFPEICVSIESTEASKASINAAFWSVSLSINA